MRSDLGSWRPAQADALVRVLEQHGIEATTEPADTPGELRVTVSRGDVERAGRVMSQRMDDIAAAAGSSRPVRAPRWYEEDDDEGGPPLMLERFRRLGGVLAVLVAGLMVAIMVPGPLRVVAAFLTIAVVVGFVLHGRRSDDDRTYGPGA